MSSQRYLQKALHKSINYDKITIDVKKHLVRSYDVKRGAGKGNDIENRVP